MVGCRTAASRLPARALCDSYSAKTNSLRDPQQSRHPGPQSGAPRSVYASRVPLSPLGKSLLSWGGGEMFFVFFATHTHTRTHARTHAHTHVSGNARARARAHTHTHLAPPLPPPPGFQNLSTFKMGKSRVSLEAGHANLLRPGHMTCFWVACSSTKDLETKVSGSTTRDLEYLWYHYNQTVQHYHQGRWR